MPYAADAIFSATPKIASGKFLHHHPNAPLERQELPCLYLAHHEPESGTNITVIFINIIRMMRSAAGCNLWCTGCSSAGWR